MANSALPGRFVWHDLLTTDVDAAIRFYKELFGWVVRDVEMGSHGQYPMFYLGETAIGGCAPLPATSPTPPHWIAYVTVADVDATVIATTRLGGMVLVAASDIPGIGRFAVVADAHGARIAPFAAAGEPVPESAGPLPDGAFCRNELLTPDPERSAQFYGALLGWTERTRDAGAMGTYTLNLRGGRETAGMRRTSSGAASQAYWLPYIQVADADVAVTSASQLGGSTHVPPTVIPTVGRFSVLGDPTGAKFGVLQPFAR